MRIKKTRILSMLMTMVLLSSNVLPIYAEASAGDDVTYCYNNDFNTEQNLDDQMSSGADYSQVIDAETQEGYVKMGYAKANVNAQFSAELTKTDVKSMFIELELSAPNGSPAGGIRIAGLPYSSGTTLQNDNLLFFNEKGLSV